MQPLKNKTKIKPYYEALKISLPYLIVGLLWIFLSDSIVGSLLKGVEEFGLVAIIKGTAYVFVTALLLFLLVRKLVLRLKAQQDDLDEQVKQRTQELAESVKKMSESELQKDELLKHMRQQHLFQNLIFMLSQEFFNAKEEEFEASLSSALRRIGEYMDEDRIFYVTYDWNSESLHLKIEHNKKGIPPIDPKWYQKSFKDVGEIVGAHMRGRDFYIADTNAQRAESRLSGKLYEDGVRAFIAIPVQSQGKPRGFIGICSLTEPKKWEPEALAVLTIFTEMIRNAYGRVDREAAMKATNSHLRVILNSTRDGIFLLDLEGRVIIANKAFAQRYQTSIEQSIGQDIKDLIPNEQYERHEPVYRRVMETGIQEVYRDMDGERFIEGTVYPVYGQDGRINGVAAFVADITRRVNNEREIFRSHQMLQELINDAPVGIFWKDTKGHYLGVNRVMADSLQTTPEDMIGRTNADFMTKEDAQESTFHDMQVMETRSSNAYNLRRMITKTGDTRLFQINKAPLYNQDGEVYALLGVAQDVTQQHQKEKELIEAKQAASAASRYKSEFLSRMSHEIRTPLNAIIGLTHVAMESEDVLQTKELLDKVNVSSKHLLSIVNDVLDISRIEAGKMSVGHEETDIIAVIEEVVGIVLQHANEKKQHIDLYIDEHLPRYVLSDAIRLKQVLMNLLSNAVKFTPESGEIKVSAQLQKRTDNQVIARFSVSDNGIGIDKDALPRLFRPFEQVDSTLTREHEGTGLGLTISRTITELMGGEMGVQSEPGQGSTFYFVLPLEISQKAPASIDVAFEDLHVLVVDDDESTCVYMESLLDKFGVDSKWVLSGRKALETMCAQESLGKAFNVVFVDWRMPDMNGIETVREIRRICKPDTVVIMFSMFEWEEIQPQAKEAGVSLFLSKPVFPSKLLNTLYKICKTPQNKVSQDLRSGVLEGRRILVAEDVRINQYIIKELLKFSGVEITQAMDGQEALDIFIQNQGNFDALLMDIQMPVLDGLEATRRIRSCGAPCAQTVPIIAMTANVFAEDIEKALMAGMDAHVGKPIDAEVLLGTLCSFILKP